MFWMPETEVEQRGYDRVLVGWTLRSPTPIGATDVAVLKADAGDVFTFAHADNVQSSTLPARRLALGIGSALGLTILIIIGALMRAESAEEEHAFVAIGARRWFRRRVAAASAALLALYAALLAVPIGALTSVGMHSALRESSPGFVVPLDALITIFILFPAIASIGAAVLTRPTPVSLPRRM